MSGSGEVGALRITLGLDTIDFTQGMQNINRRLQALNSEFRAISTGAAKFDNSLDTLRNRSDVLTRTMETHRRKVEELKRKYEESKAQKGEDAAETVRLATAYNNAVSAMRKTEQQLNRVNQQIEQQTNSFNNLEQEVNTNVSNITRQMQVLETGYAAAAAGAGDLGNSVEGLRQRQEHLTSSLNLHQQRVAELTRLHEESVRANGADAAATQDLQIRLNRATQQMRETEHQLEQINEQVNQQTNRWHQLSTGLTNIGEHFEKTGEKVKSTGENLSKFVTAPIVGIGVMAGKAANDFDISAGRIQARLGVTAQEAEKLNETAKAVWTEGFGEDVKEVGDAITIVRNNLKGLSDDELKQAAESAFTLSKTFDVEVNESTKTASSLMKNFGVDATKAFDIITTGFQQGGDFSNELLDTLNEYSVQFASMGLSAEQFLSILISGFNAGAFNLDKVGDAVKEFNIRAQDGSKTTEQGFEAIGLSAQKMGEAIAAGGEEGQKAFVATISALAAMKDPMQQNIAGVNLFGTQWEDVRKNVITAMSDAVKHVQKVDGATKKASEAIQDNFGTKLQQVWREFEKDMQPVGDDLLKIAKDSLPKVAESIKKVTGAFASLSPETQKTVITIAGIAAASGPAMVAIGSLSSGIGLLMKGVAPLVAAIGTEGLVGALTALTGPVGLTVGAIGLATVAVVGLTKSLHENKTVSFEALQARQEEIKSNDDLIKKYEDLKIKNQLSNDEMLRFLDIQSELKQTADPEVIAKLKKEQDGLREKSGLTNEQMQHFLKYNDEIIEKAPNTEKAISVQGNAYATNADALKNLNREKLESLKIDALNKITDSLQKENDLRRQHRDIVKDIKTLDAERTKTYSKINDLAGQIKSKEQEVADLKKDLDEASASHDIDAINKANAKLGIAQRELETLYGQKAAEESKRDSLNKQLGTKMKSRDETEKELKALDEEKFKYESLVLSQVGLTSEKGKGLATIELEIAKLMQAKEEAEKLHAAGKLNTAEYNDQVQSIDSQIGKLQGAKTELERINQTAGEKVYKDIVVDGNGEAKKYADELNVVLGKPVEKQVNVDPNGTGQGTANNINAVLQKLVFKEVAIDPQGTAWSRIQQINSAAAKGQNKNITVDPSGSAAGKIASLNSESGKTVPKNINVDPGGTAWSKAQSISAEAGKSASKSISVTDHGKTDEIHREAEKDAHKNVFLNAIWTGAKAALHAIGIAGFATGTKNAPGGLSLVGEEGPELVYLPRGASVVPANDTLQILRKWNIPAYANGTPDAASTKNMLLNTPTTDNTALVDAIYNLASRPIKLIIDGREFAYATVDDITEIQNFKSRRLALF